MTPCELLFKGIPVRSSVAHIFESRSRNWVDVTKSSETLLSYGRVSIKWARLQKPNHFDMYW